jgi:hypothetical protein
MVSCKSVDAGRGMLVGEDWWKFVEDLEVN